MVLPLSWSQISRLILTGLLLVKLSGCGDRPNAPWLKWGTKPTPIAQLTDVTNPPKANVVLLQGEVGDRVDLLGSRAYELQDDTGSVWILSDREPLPKSGTQLKVKGEVHFQSIPLFGQEFGEVYVAEIAQSNSDSATSEDVQ